MSEENISFRQSFKNIWKYSLILLWIGALASALASCDSFASAEVQEVKNGHLLSHPDKTIGDAVAGFLGLPIWTSGTSDKGVQFVNVKGQIKYMEKQITAVLQFRLDKGKSTFEASALEFNGIPQNALIMNALISKMYQ